MMPRLNHTLMMSRVMTHTLAVVARAKVDINPHVAVANSLEADELMVEMVREAMGQTVKVVESVKKITSRPSAQICATQRQTSMSWLQLFLRTSDPEYVSNALTL